MEVKSVGKKLIICIVIFMMLFNFIISSTKIDKSFAASSTTMDEFMENAGDLLSKTMNGLAGILTWVVRAPILGAVAYIQVAEYNVINTAGNDGTVESVFVTPFDVFFNRFTLTNINFFQTDDLADEKGNVDEDGFVYKLRMNVRNIYYIFQSVALMLLLVMLIIVGIKSALSTLADDKAKWKQAFRDWVISFGLVALMSFIVVAVVNINESLVEVLKNVAKGSNISNFMNALFNAAFGIDFLLSIGAFIIYVIMVIQTFFFIIVYIKRLLVVLFLVVISPLVPIKYAIDKFKGNQTTGLHIWFREFVYNVFIQVLHCIIYIVIIGVPLGMLAGQETVGGIESLGVSILFVLSMLFVKKAEELLKQIFGFDKATSLSSFSTEVNNAQKAVLTGVSMSNGTYTVTNNMANNTTNFGSNIQNFGQAAGNKLHEYKDKAANYLSGIADKYDKEDNEENKEDNADANENENENGEESNSSAYEDKDDNEKAIDDLKDRKEEAESLLETEKDPKIRAEIESDLEKINDEIERRTSQNNKEEIEEVNEETTEETEEIAVPDDLDGKDKETYQEFIKIIKEETEKQKELQEKLEELKNSIGEEQAEKIKQDIDNLFETKGKAAADEYAQSLADTLGSKQAEFANLYIKQVVSEITVDAAESGIDDIYKNKGMERPKAEAEPEIDVKDGQVVNLDEARMRREMARINPRNFEMTAKNAKALEMIDGEISLEGDYSNKNLTQFNLKILDRVKKGDYRADSIKVAREKLEEAGDVAVARYERFMKEQTEENARNLTVEGKELASRVIGAEQANYVMTSYKESSSSIINSQRVTGTQVISSTSPANRNNTNNVIENLGDRRKRA